MSDIHNPIFKTERKAREWLEARIWPDGPFCPHCGERENWTRLHGEKHRPGLYQCNNKECREQFTVTVGTLFERSKIPLKTWLLATYLLCASKKGMSTRQFSRMMGISVKSAWFMIHRIREALRDNPDLVGPLGGSNKVVEADETFIGGNAKTLRPILVTQIDRKSYLMTDEAGSYVKVGREFVGHGTVNHSIQEYVRGGFWHTNTVENYFSILKRGITGVYQHVSQKHLKRYLGEFDFRYNTRDVDDMARTALAVAGACGKRMTYRRIGV